MIAHDLLTDRNGDHGPECRLNPITAPLVFLTSDHMVITAGSVVNRAIVSMLLDTTQAYS
jgi:hypothetical protein